MHNINKLRIATLLVIGLLFAGGTASYAFPFMGNGYGGGYGGGFNNRMFSGYNNGGCGWRHHRHHRHGW